MTLSFDQSQIRENIPLAPLTTLGVGGPARYFIQATSEHDVLAAFAYAKEKDLPVFVLGGGSNILVSDQGFDGLVIQIAIKGVSFDNDGDTTMVSAAAGEDWDDLVETCVNQGLAGIECLSGIPGFVGGTPVQNVGAYGQEVSETIVSVRCFDRQNTAIVELTNSECGFSYRKSIFNSTLKDRYTVLSVNYALRVDGPPKLVYKELVERLGQRQATLSEVRQAVLQIRRAKSMVIDPADPNSKSAGSFFKNPIVPSNDLENFVRIHGGSVPSFPAGDGMVKIPAAWLIENAGFRKGFQMGRAGISANHSLAIINSGSASAAEIFELMSAIQRAVKSRFNIELMPEPVFVGFDV